MEHIPGSATTMLAAIQAGGDLQVAMFRIRYPGDRQYPGDRRVWEIQAFDGGGNPLMVLGAFTDYPSALAMLPTCVTLAREAYGSELSVRSRRLDEFDLVAWRVEPESGRGWEWTTDGDNGSLGKGLGEETVVS